MRTRHRTLVASVIVVFILFFDACTDSADGDDGTVTDTGTDQSLDTALDRSPEELGDEEPDDGPCPGATHAPEGTCVYPALSCFDPSEECTPNAATLTYEYENGARAVLTLDPPMGTYSASDGTECFRLTAIDENTDRVVDSSDGAEMTIHGEGGCMVITCPDASTQVTGVEQMLESLGWPREGECPSAL